MKLNRRDFLRSGALAGAAVGVGGCATLSLRPPSDAFSLEGMKGFFANLDQAMKQVFSRPPPSLLPAASDPRAERLSRQGLGALLLSGSFHDLSPEDQVHPGMQARIGHSASLFDRAALGMNDHLQSLSPTERRDLSLALREDPELGTRVIAMLDGEAASAGVPQARRLKLRTIGLHACSRLQQSPSLIIDEYAAKVEKVAARQGDAEAFERQLIARMGQEAFVAHKEKLLGASARWQELLARQGGEEEPPPSASRPAEDPTDWSGQPAAPKRWAETPVGDRAPRDAAPTWSAGLRPGEAALGVGGVLFGLGLLTGLAGLIIGVTSQLWLTMAYVFTAAGLLVIAGLVCLIIGLVLRVRAG